MDPLDVPVKNHVISVVKIYIFHKKNKQKQKKDIDIPEEKYWTQIYAVLI